jgi:hypothetical protein
MEHGGGEAMGNEKILCEHGCRNTCAMLIDALKDEKQKLTYYESMMSQCDEPEMRKFIKEIIGSHHSIIKRMTDRLSEIRARAESLDGVISSYEA